MLKRKDRRGKVISLPVAKVTTCSGVVQRSFDDTGWNGEVIDDRAFLIGHRETEVRQNCAHARRIYSSYEFTAVMNLSVPSKVN